MAFYDQIRSPAVSSDHELQQMIKKVGEDEEGTEREATFKIAVSKTIQDHDIDAQKTDIKIDFETDTPSILSDNLVEAQPINIIGNNRLFIFHHLVSNRCSKFPERFIAKEFGDNKDELNTYKQLVSLQGVCIPKCFGQIKWVDEEGTIHQGIALEYLEPGVDTKDHFIYENCRKALNLISNQGVYHGDIALRNLMWHSETRQLRVVDFEMSKESTDMWLWHCDYAQRNGKELPNIQEQSIIDLDSFFTLESILSSNENGERLEKATCIS
ncbi:hypothetical protein EAF04_001357 [Stromatinia cepivora]|nr:hypothetical protein EAF04_001357 [Stromatinia cepivora]